MMFQGYEFTGKDPFKNVLLHGLIRDEKGVKMSKSAGNGVDPMDVISQYGIDALRYFIVSNSAPGMDTRYDITKVESAWNLINKLWNITRFVTLNIGDASSEIDESKLNLFDKWILTRLSEVIKEADSFYERFEFNEVAKVLQNFIWDEFASWYLELSKVSLQDEKMSENTQAVLKYVLKDVLKMMHPFIPFVTEKLFLEIYDEKSIMVSDWSVIKYHFQEEVTAFAEIEAVITKIRNLRNEYNVLPSKSLDIVLQFKNDDLANELKTYHVYLTKFLNAKKLSYELKYQSDDAILLAGANVNIYVMKTDLIDLKAEKESLLKQKEALEKEIARSEGLLNNQSFISKAPADKLASEKEKYENYKKQYQDVIEKLAKHV